MSIILPSSEPTTIERRRGRGRGRGRGRREREICDTPMYHPSMKTFLHWMLKIRPDLTCDLI
jgi:hypothetical protein